MAQYGEVLIAPLKNGGPSASELTNHVLTLDGFDFNPGLPVEGVGGWVVR